MSSGSIRGRHLTHSNCHSGISAAVALPWVEQVKQPRWAALYDAPPRHPASSIMSEVVPMRGCCQCSFEDGEPPISGLRLPGYQWQSEVTRSRVSCRALTQPEVHVLLHQPVELRLGQGRWTDSIGLVFGSNEVKGSAVKGPSTSLPYRLRNIIQLIMTAAVDINTLTSVVSVIYGVNNRSAENSLIRFGVYLMKHTYSLK